MFLIQLLASTGRFSLFSKADWNSYVSCRTAECIELIKKIQGRFQNDYKSTFTDALSSCLARNLSGQRFNLARSDIIRGSTVNLTLNDLQIIESCLINPSSVHGVPTNPPRPTSVSTPPPNPSPTSTQTGSYACPAGQTRRLCYIGKNNVCQQKSICFPAGKNCSNKSWLVGESYVPMSEGLCSSFQCPQNMIVRRLYCHYFSRNDNSCVNLTLCGPSGLTCANYAQTLFGRDFGGSTYLEDKNCDGSTGLNWINN